MVTRHTPERRGTGNVQEVAGCVSGGTFGLGLGLWARSLRILYSFLMPVHMCLLHGALLHAGICHSLAMCAPRVHRTASCWRRPLTPTRKTSRND
eukprot:3495880-Amphidinium_carterae.1